MLNHFRSGSISDAEPVESRGPHENVIPAHAAAELPVHGNSATLTQHQPAIGCNIQLSIEGNRAKCSPNPVYAAKTVSVTGNAVASGIGLGFGTKVLHVVYHGRMQRPDRGRDVIPRVCQRKDDAL